MLLSYKEAVKEYGNQYRLTRALEDGKLYKMEDGVYSTQNMHQNWL